jgi:phosphatidylserine decarboxylase
MVRDGYLYAAPLFAAAILLGWLTNPAWAVIPCLLAFFFLWFFRDPERAIPQDAGAVVSPGDGKVTDVSTITVSGRQQMRLSIFLSVFNVHVNRSPITGIIRDVRYKRGKYLNAMNKTSADLNEQNIVTVENDGDGQTVVFKQIAGLLARRIVFHPKVGDRLERGQRVGLIKFGSRVDVVLDASARPNVKVGDRVKGGASVLAYLQPQGVLAAAGASATAKAPAEKAHYEKAH